jgi:hypothetical protein
MYVRSRSHRPHVKSELSYRTIAHSRVTGGESLQTCRAAMKTLEKLQAVTGGRHGVALQLKRLVIWLKTIEA